VTLLGAYRATGADLPWGDPLPAHTGVRMEGYFWRFTDPAGGRVVIALCGVNRARDGFWSTLGLASHPNGFLRTVAHPEGWADPRALGARAGSAFAGNADRLAVDLGDDAQLDVRVSDAVPWSRRSLGGSSIFQAVPALNQYWHPWLLGGRAHGSAVVGGRRWDLDGWQVYAEKNWGAGGFPTAWWWGQAQGFNESDVCVAFAGGKIHSGPLRTEVTAVVVRLPGGRLLRLGDPLISPTTARVTDESWSLRAHSPRFTVEIEGRSPLGSAHVLPVPLPLERRNVPGAIEHLGGRMDVVVRERGRELWRGTSQLAALEHGGIERAVAETRRRGAGALVEDAAPI
jgi:Tocopherol cyclase